MHSALAASYGIWSDTVGLLFTYVVLIPALMTGLVVVAIITAKGEKQADDELRGRWGPKRGSAD